MLAGMPAMAGASASTTVTAKLPVEVLPAASMAV